MNSINQVDINSPDSVAMTATFGSPPELSLLTPVVMKPKRPTKKWRQTKYLNIIESVQINETRTIDGVVHYVLDVYLYSTNSRIPTNNRFPGNMATSSSMNDPDRQPDYQLERSFTDFCNFRRKVSDSTCHTHSMLVITSTCVYCNAISKYLEHELTQPNTITKCLVPGLFRKRMLQDFTNDFIKFVQQRPDHSRLCKCVVKVPQLLEALVANPQVDE